MADANVMRHATICIGGNARKSNPIDLGGRPFDLCVLPRPILADIVILAVGFGPSADGVPAFRDGGETHDVAMLGIGARSRTLDGNLLKEE